MIRTLITHDGSFHADEAFATAVLSTLFPEAEILRTRDAGRIAELSSTAVTYDVGFAYNPERRVFDHHQPGAPRRADGTPFSAFGLIWTHYGRDWLRAVSPELSAAERVVERVHAEIDARIVLPVDLIDNGVLAPKDLGPAGALSLTAVIDALNPEPALGAEGETAGFDQAVRLADVALKAHLAQIGLALRAESVVEAAIHSQWGAPVLELNANAPFQSTIERTDAAHVLYVVRPRKTDWTVTGVAVEQGGFTLRRDLPAAWAGLEGAELEAATGVPGAIFCHKARFMVAARDRETALRLAALAAA